MNPTTSRPPARPAAPLFLLSLGLSGLALAQSTTPPAAPPPAAAVQTETPLKLEAFTVTGSNIRRLDQEKVLPVTVIGREAMEARDAMTPVQLLTALPQVVSVPINESNGTGAIARGDVAAISLRGLSSGNTLVLLNGRRLANHPITQNESAVLTSSVNVNQLPNRGVSRVEFLRDGASAVYGSDAIAGVVNYLMDSEFRGVEFSSQIGRPEEGGAEYGRVTMTLGTDFAGGRARLLSVLDGYARKELYLSDRDVSKDADKSARAPAPFNVTTSPFFDRNASGPYASFRVGSATATRYLVPTAPGVVGFTTATPARTGITADYYYNINSDQMNLPKTERINWFNRLEVDLTDRLTAFGEFSYYDSFTDFRRSPLPYSSGADLPLILGLDNPYNPFGSRFYHATGAPNADGTPRVTGAPQTTRIMSFRVMDMGQERVEIDTDIFRVLGGIRGRLGGTWTWEAAAFYTRARTVDEVQNALRESTMLASALKSDSSAFNPFGYTFRVVNGAVVPDQAYKNPVSVMAPIYDRLPNVGESSITSLDLRTSGEVIDLWSGPLSLAVGAEYREEELSHTRPPFAGLNPASSGLDPTNNDFIQASATANIVGGRTVTSAYAETVIPLVSDKHELPLARSLEATASVRFESYDDFGETTKPKFGLNWKPMPWLMVRASYNEGFRAPNLAVLNQRERTFVQAYADTFRVPITSLASDGTVNRTYTTAGNSALEPEFSKGQSVGVVVDVPWVKGLSFTVDVWEIKQRNLIDADTTAQVVSNDYQLLRAFTQKQLASGVAIGAINTGSGTANYAGDPRITRAAVPAADLAAFTAYNASRPAADQIAPFGPLTSLRTAFSNSSEAFVSGTDVAVTYRLPELPVGRFSLGTEWAYLEESYSTLPASTVRDVRINQNGAARWRGNAHVSWRRADWTAGLSAYYVGAFADTGASTTQAVYESLGQPSYIMVAEDQGVMNYWYRVEESLSFNAFVSKRFGPDAGKWWRNTSVRLGVTNLTAEEPPLSADPSGYQASVYNYLAVGRTWTLEVTRRF
jgi:iron complex outermembrane receptor protein